MYIWYDCDKEICTPTELTKGFFPQYAPERDLIATSVMQVKRTGQNHCGFESLRRNVAQIFYQKFLENCQKKNLHVSIQCCYAIIRNRLVALILQSGADKLLQKKKAEWDEGNKRVACGKHDGNMTNLFHVFIFV